MLFSFLIFDEPESAAIRDEYRQRHLDYLKGFDDQTLFAGPFTTDDESVDLGSLRLVDFPDRAAADIHMADEPYVIGGAQKRWIIKRWWPSVPHTWRDCPRTEGNIQAMFHGIDGPEGPAIRAANKPAHEDYLNEHGNSIICRGPMLDDHGAALVGSVLLMDIPNMAAARELLQNEPYYKAGCYRDITFHRWRFGRVFDRYKVPV